MFYHAKWYIRAAFALPVLIVLGIYFGIYYSFIYGFVMVCEPSIFLMTFYLFFHLILFLDIWAYLKTAFTDPGTTPENFELLPEEVMFTSQADYNTEDYLRGKANYCRKCARKRPVRTHHCSLCNRCILRMDHHCPWVGNCVGFNNHKFFLQFLCYAFINCAVVSLANGYILFYEPSVSPRQRKNYFTLLGAIGGLSISLAVGGLGCFHQWLLMTNRSSLELGSFSFNVFDTGSWLANYTQVCGSDWKLWLLPIKGTDMGDGVFYPLKLRNLDGGVEYFVGKVLS